MEGYRRQFDEESNHQHDEQHFLQTFAEEPCATCIGRLCVSNQGWDVKGASRPSPSVREVLGLEEVHRHQTQEHDNRGGEGVDEELLRGVLAVVSTPLENEEEHWNQRQFPEHIEHEQVKRNEHANERTAHHQHQREVHGCVLFMPGCNDGNGQQESRQPHHREGQGIHADAPMDA